MKLRFSTRTLLVVTGLCAVVLSVPYWLPRSQTLSIHTSYTGYYRGLCLTNGGGYFGRVWYRVVVDESPEGYWEADVNGLGYNSYRGYYPNGVLREEGMCMVERNGSEIAPDRHDLQWGRFYDPEGHLLSEVVDKTGKQILCYSTGKPSWELDLVDGTRAHVKTWHANGQLALEHSYCDGLDHGTSTSYFATGQVQCRAEYANGNRTGTWTYYTIDGKVESQIAYGASAE